MADARAQSASTGSLDATGLVASLRSSFRSRRTRSMAWRAGELDALQRLLIDNEERIIDAIVADLGKPRFEAKTTELAFLQSEIAHARKHLHTWMKPEKVKTSLVAQPAKSYIHNDPLGVVLIIGAWNYPVHLTLGPLIGAIAAGNCAVVKPSEIASHSSAVMAELLPRYLDSECIRVVEGGIPETTELLAQKWDHIFYTGNGTVGRIVMKAAAEHLTPVTLELGGKSPALVDIDADIKAAARRLVFGKFTNAGQTCVAPDYVLAHESCYDALLIALKETIVEFYSATPQSSPDYGRIINERHHQRLVALLDSGTVAHGGDHNVDTRYIAPTLLTDVAPDSPVMAEEIFGPILPILKVRSIDESIDFVNDRAKPLALYVFSENKSCAARVVANTAFGGGSINHVWMHLSVPSLPFGGVGESGMGAYHGKHSFDVFTHRKAVLDKGTFIDPNITYPPYTEFKQRLIKKIV